MGSKTKATTNASVTVLPTKEVEPEHATVAPMKKSSEGGFFDGIKNFFSRLFGKE